MTISFFERQSRRDAPTVAHPRCDECGHFTPASELISVFGPMIDDGLDHYACVECRTKTRRRRDDLF